MDVLQAQGQVEGKSRATFRFRFRNVRLSPRRSLAHGYDYQTGAELRRRKQCEPARTVRPVRFSACRRQRSRCCSLYFHKAGVSTQKLKSQFDVLFSGQSLENCIQRQMMLFSKGTMMTTEWSSQRITAQLSQWCSLMAPAVSELAGRPIYLITTSVTASKIFGE